MKKYLAYGLLGLTGLLFFIAPLLFMPWDVYLLGLGINGLGFGSIIRWLHLSHKHNGTPSPFEVPWYDKIALLVTGLGFLFVIGLLVYAFIEGGKMAYESLGWFGIILYACYISLLAGVIWAMNEVT